MQKIKLNLQSTFYNLFAGLKEAETSNLYEDLLSTNYRMHIELNPNDTGSVGITVELIELPIKTANLKNSKPDHKYLVDGPGSAFPIPSKLIPIYRELIYKYLVTEGNYKDCDLSLVSMSFHLKIPQKYISCLISRELGIGFNDYVNYLRIHHFNKIELREENNVFTREAIAKLCGFSSYSTFYRAQKKFQDKEFAFHQ